MLVAKTCYLRAIEPDDLDFLYDAENESDLWHVGELKQPLSLHTIQAYLDNAHQPIDEAKQARFVICTQNHIRVGMVDLFDYDAKNQRAGIGIVILKECREKGFAKEAILCTLDYAKKHLLLHQLHCQIQESNTKSVALFSKCGFTIMGTFIDWQRTKSGFENVLFMQCIL